MLLCCESLCATKLHWLSMSTGVSRQLLTFHFRLNFSFKIWESSWFWQFTASEYTTQLGQGHGKIVVTVDKKANRKCRSVTGREHASPALKPSTLNNVCRYTGNTNQQARQTQQYNSCQITTFCHTHLQTHIHPYRATAYHQPPDGQETKKGNALKARMELNRAQRQGLWL